MKLFGNLKLRSRPAVLGAFVAWQLFVALVAIAPAFIAAPTVAQKPVNCFMRVECVDASTKGTCDKQHCFEVRRECPDGQGLCYANPPAVPLIIAIGGKNRALDLGDYIAIVYNYGVGFAGIVATVMFMIGGFQVLTAGSSDRVSKGKERIKNAIIGMLLAFGALIMLRTVNPDILRLQMPKIEIVKKKPFIGCNVFEMRVKCGDPFSIVFKPGSDKNLPIEEQFRLATPEEIKANVGIICRGMSCGKTGPGIDDGSFRCQKDPTKSGTLPAAEPTQCGGPPAAPYVCKACAGWGGDCKSQGKSDDCCTGFCGTRSNALQATDVATTAAAGAVAGAATTVGKGLCTNGEAGVNCDSNSECRSGRCETRGLNHCSSGLTGAACDNAQQCAGGYACPQVTGVFICIPKLPGGYCLDPKDCPEGYECPRGRELCGAVGAAAGAVSDAAAAAQAGLSDIGRTTIAKFEKIYEDAKVTCSTANNECNADVGAAKKSDSWLDNARAFTGTYPSCANAILQCGKVALAFASLNQQKLNFGIADVGVGGVQSAAKSATDVVNCGRCTAAGKKTICSTAADCEYLGPTAKCANSDRDMKICTTGVDGSPCMSPGDCNSGHCINAITAVSGTPGVCSDGGVGERCSESGDCLSKHCYKGDKLTALLQASTAVGGALTKEYGFCTAGIAGAGCNPADNDTDCEKELTCSKQAHICIVKNSCP